MDCALGSQILGRVFVRQFQRDGRFEQHRTWCRENEIGTAKFERVGMIAMLCRWRTGTDLVASAIGFGIGHGYRAGDVVVGQIVCGEDRGDELAVAGGSVHDCFGKLCGGG